MRYLTLLLLFASTAFAQLGIAPDVHPIFLGNNGQPAAGGFLYTYAAGTTTLQPTFTDATGLIANSNPIPLDSTGAPSNGSVQTQIWLSNTAYKFCLWSNLLVQQWCSDNVMPSPNVLNTGNTWQLQQFFNQPIVIQFVDSQIVTGNPGNQTTLDFPPPAGNIILSFPNTQDTIVGRNTTDTLNNKNLITPLVNGVEMVNSPGTYVNLSNGSPTGTVQNSLAIQVGATVQAAPAGSTSGILGVCVANCGNVSSGTQAVIETTGTAFCNFDGATTAGHYFQVSSTAIGNCKDAGASLPTTGQILGRIMQSTAGAGASAVILFGGDLQNRPNPPAITSIVAGSGAGTSPTISCIGCTDIGGTVSLTTGTSPGTASTIATITASGTYSKYICTFSPDSATAAALSSTTSVWANAQSGPPSTYVFTSGSAALTAATIYNWQYTCTVSY